MTLGEYLVKLLESYDVTTVFGIPGVHTIEMYRGLAASSITHITPRHEQGAGFMADGYARVSGKPGVAFVITGPGVTNIVTPMAQAYADSIPMLVISAVNRQGSLGHGEGDLHESPNQSQLAAQAAAFSFRVSAPADLPKAIARAFAVFEGARPRPVHIEIPLDLFAAPAEGLPESRQTILTRAAPAASAIAQAAILCQSAKKPVILLGGGARQAAQDAQALAEHLDAPAVMTVNARGILPPDHPLAVPASPSLQSVRDLVAASDLVLAFGTELGRTDYNMFDQTPFEVTAPLIRAEIEAEQLARNAPCDIPLLGDAGEAMRALKSALGASSGKKGAARAHQTRKAALAEQSEGYLKMIAFLDTIRNTLPDATIVGDSTQAIYAGNLYFAASQPSSWFNASTGFGALGYGLPAAIGAKLAKPDSPVVCIAGDGGIQFTLGELGAAMEVGGPLIIIVWNNQGYGEIKSNMIASNVTPVGVDLITPDFTTIAKAYGMASTRLEHLADLPALLTSSTASKAPLLIEVPEPVVLS